ncbi:unnamed protein product [Orchesella dallaii]
MDGGVIPSGPNYGSSNNNPNQNYMSYYWPEYFSNSQSGGGMYRAGGGSDNPAHVMVDPVQQLQNVNAYSYAQSYPQSPEMVNYNPSGRTHPTEHDGRAGLLAGLLGSHQKPAISSTSQLILMNPQQTQQSFSVVPLDNQRFEPQQQIFSDAVLLNAMQNHPSAFGLSQPAHASTLEVNLLNNNQDFQHPFDSNMNLADLEILNNNHQLNSHSSPFIFHNQELLALDALGGNQQLAFPNNFNQFTSSPHIVVLTKDQLLALQSTTNTNPFSEFTPVSTQNNAKKIFFTSNINGISNQERINAEILALQQPQSFTNNDAILVSTSGESVKGSNLVQDSTLKKAMIQAEIANLEKVQSASQVKSDQKSPVVVVVSDQSTLQENHPAERIIISDVGVQNIQSSSPIASQKHTLSKESIANAIQLAFAQRQESREPHATVLKLDATDNSQGNSILISQNDNTALKEAILEVEAFQTEAAIEQAKENRVMAALVQNTNAEQQKETLKVVEQIMENQQNQQAATKNEKNLISVSLAARANDAYNTPISSYQAPSNYPRENYQDTGVPTSLLDTVYPGVSSVVSLPSRGPAPMSIYQPQSQYTSSPSPYQSYPNVAPVYDLPQQYSFPYSSPVSNYGQMVQPVRYGYASVPTNSNVYAPYAGQAISSPVYNSGSGYYAVPRAVRSSVVPQPQPVVRYVYGVQPQVPVNVVG